MSKNEQLALQKVVNMKHNYLKISDIHTIAESYQIRIQANWKTKHRTDETASKEPQKETPVIIRVHPQQIYQTNDF